MSYTKTTLLDGLTPTQLTLVEKLIRALKTPPQKNQNDKTGRLKLAIKSTIPNDVDTWLNNEAKKQKLDKGDLVAAFIKDPVTTSLKRTNTPNGEIRKNVAFRLNDDVVQIANIFAEATGMRRGAWIGQQLETRYAEFKAQKT